MWKRCCRTVQAGRSLAFLHGAACLPESCKVLGSRHMKISRAFVFISAVALASCSATGAKSPLNQGDYVRSPAGVHSAPPAPAAPSPVSTGTDSATEPFKAAPSSAGSTPDRPSDPQKRSDSPSEPKPTTILPRLSGKLPTGLMTSPSARAERPAGPADAEKQKVVFNFDKADLAEVSSQIFGDFLKLNYVLDPTLQGRISLYLEGEFTREELLQMVTRAYEANAVSVSPRKGIYYIQPIQKSSGSSLPIADAFTLQADRDGARPVIVIYRLRYLDVKQAANTIKFFLTPGRPITPDPMTNSLVFIEGSENARSIVEVLKTLDINFLAEVSMEIVPLKSLAPQDAAQSMDALIGKLGVFKESAIKNNLAIIPLQNFGGVLVLAQNPELLKTAKSWLEALDVRGQEVGEQIYVYFVQNGLAIDIADILNQVYGLRGAERRPDQQIVSATRTTFGRGGGLGTSSSSSGRLGGSSLSGSRAFGSSSGSPYSGSLSGGTMGSSGMGGTSGFGSTPTGIGTTQRGTPRTGAAAGARTTPGTQPASSLTGEVIIIPDEVNNAIVIRANATDYAKIKKTLETLDILPRAVLIEVMIAEVRLDKRFEYGLEWWFKNAGVGSGNVAGSLNGLGPPPIDVATASATGGVALSWVSNAKDIATLLRLLSDQTDVKVLSNPTLLAADNKEATITVGGREPVPTGSYAPTTAGGEAFTTISYEDTGVILNVIPHINAGGLVRLEVEQIIRRTGAEKQVGAGNTAPSFTERNVKTTLLAQDGNTVVIGGIIEENKNMTDKGIPFLKDIPLLSPLFSYKTTTKDRTELIIAITPRVVDHRDSSFTREFLDKAKQLRRTFQYQ